MKRIAHFIAWLWNGWDIFGKVVSSYLTLWALPSLISCFWIGKYGIALAVGGILVFFFGALAVAIASAIHEKWKEFSNFHPPEDVRVINKLKGID
jgi:hypothetical protein